MQPNCNFADLNVRINPNRHHSNNMDTAIKRGDAIAKLEKILVEGLNQKLGTKFSTAHEVAVYLDAQAKETPKRKTA